MTRSRKMSMSVPREDGLASPAAWISRSSWPRPRRWPVSAVHPAGAYPMSQSRDGGVADAAAGQVAGRPAAGELAGVVGLGVAKDGQGARARPGPAAGVRRDARPEGRPGGWRHRPAGSGPRAGRGGGLLAGSRDGRGAVAVQDAVGVPDDASGGCGDAVPGGEDGRRGLGAWVAAGPACRAGELAAGGDAVPGAGDVGDGVGFGLAQPRAAGGGRPGRVAAGLVVQQDVAELVRQRPDGLLAGQAGQEPDAAGGPEGGAVGRGAVFALDRESFAAGEPAQRVPQARRGLAGRGQGRDGATGCPVVCDRSQT